MTKSNLYISKSVDPWKNLALEEYFLRNHDGKTILFYLWQNDRTVVIGKNQNAWNECRTDLLKADGGKLARRSSGGGAVYHDMGNMNFTFIVPRVDYDFEKQLGVVLAAVQGLGVPAEFSGRNDLVVHDRKFSGNAFQFTSSSALHHGTILVNTDFEQLSRYLSPPEMKIKTKGIDSVRSRVINLKEIANDMDMEILTDSLLASFEKVYGGAERLDSVNDHDSSFRELHEKYSSQEWVYGNSPAADMVFRNAFPWGNLEVCLTLESGKIKELGLYSDAMDSEVVEVLKSRFNTADIEVPHYIAEVSEKKNVPCDNDVINMKEIGAWLSRELGKLSLD